MKFMDRPDLQPIRAKAESALLASVAEFILEGMHVQNRLNKSAKAGETNVSAGDSPIRLAFARHHANAKRIRGHFSPSACRFSR